MNKRLRGGYWNLTVCDLFGNILISVCNLKAVLLLREDRFFYGNEL